MCLMVYVRVSFLKDSKKAVLLYRKKPDPKFDKTVSKKKFKSWFSWLCVHKSNVLHSTTNRGWNAKTIRNFGDLASLSSEIFRCVLCIYYYYFFLFLALNPIYFHWLDRGSVKGIENINTTKWYWVGPFWDFQCYQIQERILSATQYKLCQD